MKELLDKISSYNLFNYLLPGTLLVVILDKFMIYSFVQDNLAVDVFVYYFIGLVISRVGSLVIDPLLKKISFLRFAPYEEFVSASKKDSKIEILSEVNNMYRTLCSMFVLILLFLVYRSLVLRFSILKYGSPYTVVFILLIMFLFSYRKQSEYITKRIKANNL